VVALESGYKDKEFFYSAKIFYVFYVNLQTLQN